MAKQQGANEQEGGLMKQVGMIMDGRSRLLEVGPEEDGKEVAERWRRMTGMGDCDIRLMAEGKIVGWDQAG